MHVTLLTVGSRGDVQPFVALAAELKKANYDIRLATHDRFRPLAEAYQLEFAPIHADPQQMLRSEAGRAWLDSDRNPIELIRNMIRLGKPIFEQLIDDAAEACAGTDTIIYSLFGNAAFHLGQQLEVPTILAHLQPMMGATAEFPAPGSPTWPNNIPLLGNWYKRFSYKIVEQVLWQPFRPLVNQWRVDELGLSKLPFWGPYQQLYESQEPFLYAYSPTVIPRPSEWPDWYKITGYWFLDEPEGWEPPTDLQQFLAAGSRPIYFGFGSMTDKNPAVLTKMIVNALQANGQRGILLDGWAGLAQADLPETIFVVKDVPHAWLFSRMAAVVHHGGAGTTAAGLRAGMPNLVIPYFADQHFWAERVRLLGAGPTPLPRKWLTEEMLAQALRRAVQDDTIKRRAAEVGEAIRQENGVANAVQLLGDYWESKRPLAANKRPEVVT